MLGPTSGPENLPTEVTPSTPNPSQGRTSTGRLGLLELAQQEQSMLLKPSFLPTNPYRRGANRSAYASYPIRPRLPVRIPPAKPLTHQDIVNQVEWLFVVSSGCFTFLLATLSPFLTATLLGASTLGLGLSLPYWSAQRDLTQIYQPRQLDPWEKALYSLAIPFVALLLGQFYPLFQVVLCTAVGSALAYFFIDECILKSQADLNTALRQAAKDHNIDLVEKALRLGADPLAPDLNTLATPAEAVGTDVEAEPAARVSQGPNPTRNTAIHLAIQDNEDAVTILKLFHEQLKKPSLSLTQVLRGFKEFLNLTNRENARAWWESFRVFIYNRHNAEARAYLFAATTDLLAGYVSTLKSIILAFSQYLREQLAYTTLSSNSAGDDPLKTLEKAGLNEELKTSLKTHLDEINVTLAEKIKKSAQKNPTSANPADPMEKENPLPRREMSREEQLATLFIDPLNIDRLRTRQGEGAPILSSFTASPSNLGAGNNTAGSSEVTLEPATSAHGVTSLQTSKP